MGDTISVAVAVAVAMTMCKIPDEMWMLWNIESGQWVPAIDDPPGGENYLVALTAADIEAAAAHQLKMYDVHCVQVKVK